MSKPRINLTCHRCVLHVHVICLNMFEYLWLWSPSHLKGVMATRIIEALPNWHVSLAIWNKYTQLQKYNDKVLFLVKRAVRNIWGNMTRGLQNMTAQAFKKRKAQSQVAVLDLPGDQKNYSMELKHSCKRPQSVCQKYVVFIGYIFF